MLWMKGHTHNTYEIIKATFLCNALKCVLTSCRVKCEGIWTIQALCIIVQKYTINNYFRIICGPQIQPMGSNTNPDFANFSALQPRPLNDNIN